MYVIVSGDNVTVFPLLPVITKRTVDFLPLARDALTPNICKVLNCPLPIDAVVEEAIVALLKLKEVVATVLEGIAVLVLKLYVFAKSFADVD